MSEKEDTGKVARIRSLDDGLRFPLAVAIFLGFGSLADRDVRCPQLSYPDYIMCVEKQVSTGLDYLSDLAEEIYRRSSFYVDNR
jgi:hypothetical protein